MKIRIPRTKKGGFTLIELLLVIVIIMILAGLVLMAAGNIQKKGMRERARTELQAMAAALESYKIDNGSYPDFTNGDPTTLELPEDNEELRQALHPEEPGTKVYFEFPQNMDNVDGVPTADTSITDPFGFNYGYFYSTDAQEMVDAGGVPGFPILWSMGGQQTNTNQFIFAE